MGVDDRIARMHAELTGWRRDIHAHPELGFEENRTAGLVADRLARLRLRGAHRGRQDRRGRRAARRRRQGHARPARRHGRAADPGGEQLRAPLQARRQDARLRPRRPHHHAARRGQVPGARRGTSTARCTSSSSPPRRASAARRR